MGNNKISNLQSAAGRVLRCLLVCFLAVSLMPTPAFGSDDSSNKTIENSQSDNSQDAHSPENQIGDAFELQGGASFEDLVPDQDYVAGELLVSFSSAVSNEEVNAVANTVDAQVEEVLCPTYSDVNLATDGIAAGSSVVLEIDQGDIQSAAKSISTVGSVSSVQPNYLYDLTDVYEGIESDASTSFAMSSTASAYLSDDPLAVSLAEIEQFIPNDPALNQESYSYQFSMIGAYYAWTKARANRMATVAVVDSGITVAHEDLTGSIVSDLAYNSCTETSGIDACVDTVGHGTHVAGSIAAIVNNGVGTAGVSFGAYVIPIKCTYSRESGMSTTKASTASCIRGIRYAIEQGVKVINLSLGANNDDTLFQEAIDEAVASDISVVCAAGNSGTSEEYYPSDCDGTVSVTAVNSAGLRASFSSYNEHKTIAAPGKDIYSLSNSSNSSYKTLSGTSMAAPIVSGAIALLRVANPHLKATEVEQILYETADDAGEPGWDQYYGWGILRLDKAVMKATEDPVRGFSDMQEGQWYTNSDDFGWSVSMGLVSGYSGSLQFGPYDNISRGQLATMLWRMAGQPQIVSEEFFQDVDYTQYYADAISWARATGVIHGDSDANEFRPDDSVTREELCCMFANFAREIAGESLNVSESKLAELADYSSISAWAVQSVAWCVNAGVISGVEDDAGLRYAAPQSNAWRVSAACMITSLLRDVLHSRTF